VKVLTGKKASDARKNQTGETIKRGEITIQRETTLGGRGPPTSEGHGELNRGGANSLGKGHGRKRGKKQKKSTNSDGEHPSLNKKGCASQDFARLQKKSRSLRSKREEKRERERKKANRLPARRGSSGIVVRAEKLRGGGSIGNGAGKQITEGAGESKADNNPKNE